MERRFVLRDLACFGLCAAAVGCGSGSGGGGGGVNGVGSATVMGSVQGNAFTPMDAVAYQPGSITIVDFGGLCAHGLSDARAGAKYIYISLDNGFQVGTTQVGTTLDVRDVVWDSQCNSVSHVAASGSVTLTSVDSSGVEGTFDVTVALDGHLTGSFSAAMCTMPRRASRRPRDGAPPRAPSRSGLRWFYEASRPQVVLFPVRAPGAPLGAPLWVEIAKRRDRPGNAKSSLLFIAVTRRNASKHPCRGLTR